MDEEVVAGLLGVLAARNLDTDLVHCVSLEAGIAQLLQEPVAVRNSRSFDLNGFAHRPPLPADMQEETR